MRLLVVTHNNNQKSGANKSLISLLEAWQNVFHIDIIVNSSKGELPNEFAGKGFKCVKANYSWNYVPLRQNIIRQSAVYIRGILNYVIGMTQVKKVANKLKECKYDAVYSNTSVIDFGARLANELGIPHVWHIREFGKEDFHLLSLISKQKRIAFLKHTHDIIVISEALRKKYYDLVPDQKIIRVYNGFDITALESVNTHDLSEPIRILIAGQISKSKGQHQAINAVVKLHEKYNIELNIAGNGDTHFLEKVLNYYGNPSYIKVLGQVSDLYKLREDIDIELICSECEAFGRVTIEAMLHSIPVIGADCGCTSELIHDMENGLLFTYENIDELCSKIELLISNKELRLKLARNGHDSALSFTIEKAQDEVGRIIKNRIGV